MRRVLFLSPLLVATLTACSSEDGGTNTVPSTFDTGFPVFDATDNDTGAAPGDTGATPVDSGTAGDSTVTPTDTGTTTDAFFPDIASTKDTNVGDVIVLTDGGLPTDSSSTLPDATSFPDTAPGPDASPATVPVGKACSSNAECDPAGTMAGICSNKAESPNTIDPQPTCMALSCEGGLASLGKACGAAGAGICVSGGGFGYCRDNCSFGSSGAATGCAGKTICNVYSWSRDGASGKGVGSCYGGCTSDAECTAGQKCQVEDGLCVAALVTYPKAFGAACTSQADCRCQNAAGKTGYCSKFCITGGTGCPSGYSCDPGLPKTDATGTLFASAPTGLAGECLKNCSGDGDCSSYGGHCEANTATGVKVCRVP